MRPSLRYLIKVFLYLFFVVNYVMDAQVSEIPRVRGHVTPDGVLEEKIWSQAAMMTLDYEVRPGDNVTPPVKTVVYMAYSRKNLFVAFRASDPSPERIRARITDRDSVMSHDWVGITLDTFNDERRAYDFVCNPLGVQSDFIETFNSKNDAWDTIWYSGGKIHGQGYVVEMVIPLSSLRFQRSEGKQIWGFDAQRNYPRGVTHYMALSPRDRNNSCYLCQLKKIKGFENTKAGKNLQIDPTFFASRTRERYNGDVNNHLENSTVKEAGLTGRWGFTSNLTLSATLNPDFSQVEADAPEISINNPFEIFFQEKRPFFNDGSDFFRSKNRIIYTRMVRSPDWGVKVTGKEGANTIGAFYVEDSVTNLVFPGKEGSSSASLSQTSRNAVVRYKRDFGRKLTAGVLVTNREGEGYSNRVYGFDADLRFNASDMIRFQLLNTETDYPDDVAEDYSQDKDKFKGTLFDISYVHNARNLDVYAGYRTINSGFRADMGFMPKSGFRSAWGEAEYTFYAPPDKWWTKMILGGSYSYVTDFDGQILKRQTTGTFTYTGPLHMHSYIQFKNKKELYDLLYFKQNSFFLHHCMRPSKDIFFKVNYKWGDSVDYSNIRSGKIVHFNPGLVISSGLHLEWEIEHTYELMKHNEAEVYTANVSELKLKYQFNRKFFLRSTVQFVDYSFNRDMYYEDVDSRYRKLFAQFLFSYKVNPQTVLFLGYSDNYTGYRKGSLPLLNRTVFFKIGYALMM